MPEKKRKRSQEEPDEEIEIDVNLPEPPSKKAKRKEKKASKQNTNPPQDSQAPVKDAATPLANSTSTQHPESDSTTPTAGKRSDYGIWIGNLNFSTTKDDIRDFLTNQGQIAATEITRLHLPPPKDKGARKEEVNRGFAYIDFSTPESLAKAMLLTEHLLFGRRVLIKNAKNFEGRPEKPAESPPNGAVAGKGAKEPSKRIFVGNLGFDVTKEELFEHFGQAGTVEDVFLATFEDSGKCKGFGWVRFAEVEAAGAAVRGFIFKDVEAEVDSGGEDDVEDVHEERKSKVKKAKGRKWFINRLQGRELRCEFAEDRDTRYRKRFGKERKPFNCDDNPTTNGNDFRVRQDQAPRSGYGKFDRKAHSNPEQRREERRKRHEKMDARKIAPGQAHSGAQKASAAIVAGVGKKLSFD